jgi:Gas vesicle synthesis protein GvpL/GvpF
MSDDRGVWAYAITTGDGGADLSFLTGVAGAKVRTALAAGLTVLVSDVDLAEFGEVALRRNLEDLDWLEGVARAHHCVIEAASRLFPLLPTRLATVYSGDETMAAVLGARREELLEALERVGGRAEWGVKAYAVPEEERAERDEPAPAESPAPARAAGGGPGRGAGLAYLKRRRAQLCAQADTWRSALAAARALHAHLSRHAAASRLHAPQSPQLSGSQRPMMLNAAYLLDADDGTGFASEVAAAAGAHPELEVNLTGPWPPYSFAGDDGQQAEPVGDNADSGEQGPAVAGRDG